MKDIIFLIVNIYINNLILHLINILKNQNQNFSLNILFFKNLKKKN